jgi:hypothetical protein
MSFPKNQTNHESILPLEVDVEIISEKNEKIQKHYNLIPNKTKTLVESTQSIDTTPIFIDVQTKLVKNVDCTRCRIVGYEFISIDNASGYLAKKICETQLELPNEQKDKKIKMSNDDDSLITISINRSNF